jgi:nucleoside-diphosphate-sugar epimerase
VSEDRVLARDCTDEAKWDEFVRGISWATVHHAFRYGQLLSRCFGYLRPAYRLIEADGCAVAGLPLMEFSVGRLWRSLQSLPFDIYGGLLIHPDHIENAELHRAIARDLDAEAAKHGAFEVRLSIPVSAPPAVWRLVEGLDQVECLETSCPMLDLIRPLEEVRQCYRPEVRQALRAGVRRGITVEARGPLDTVRSLYPLYRARMVEIGATVKPWRFIEGIVSERLGVPFVARQDGRAIGFLILLVTPGIAIYWISAIEPAASRNRPMNALLDAAIGWAHANGIPRFSFGESHGQPGLVRFKDGFGPEPGRHMVAVRTYRHVVQRSWRLLEPAARRTYALWDRVSQSAPGHGAPGRVEGKHPGTSRARVERAESTPTWVAPLAGRRVLVTGATGFIGQHVVRTLLSGPDVSVRILARSAERVRETFGAAALEVRLGDLGDVASLAGLCDGVDYVIHSGSAVPFAYARGAPAGEYERVNLRGTESLAKEAACAGVRRWVQVSSTAAMGTPRELTVDENTPCRPTSPYQRSKHASEQGLLRIQREQGLEMAIVRPCLVAGAGKRRGELLKLFRLCRRGVFPVIGGRIEVEKPLVDVADVVQALVLAATRGPAGEVYLVHSGGGHTLGAILEEAGRLTGRQRSYVSIPLPVARGAARLGTWGSRVLGRQLPLTRERLDLFLMDRHIEIGKARRVLGYEPREQDLGMMLGRTYEYYVETGQL